MQTSGNQLASAIECLQKGNLVAIPTETVYGLAANALDANAVAKIFAAKNRPFFDPLIVHIGKATQLEHFAEEIPEYAWKLAESFWPGPITLILPKKQVIPYLVTSNQDTVGLRVPNHLLSLELLQNLDFPLAAPSANPFGYVSPTTAKHVSDQLGDKLCYILDGGKCKVGIESTIVDCTTKIPKILRLGGLEIEKIEAAIGEVKIEIASQSNPVAPGLLEKHYSPSATVILAEKNENELIELHASKKMALLRYNQAIKSFPEKDQFILSPNNSTQTAAANLFELLRFLDGLKYEIIIAELAPEEELGPAINDRLRRAAAK